MTICIGALCADSKGNANRIVIAATDRMVTFGGFMEFEHEIPKAMDLSSNAVGLMAGDAIKGSRLQRDVRQQIPGDPAVQDVANLAANLYVLHRRQEIETTLFTPRGFGLNDFYAGGLSQRMPPPIAQFLDTQAAQFDFGVELLIVGLDDNGGHIFRVGNPGGAASDFEQIGYHAIGSGAIHAVQALVGFGHSGQRALAEALFGVYVAKRRAEVAPGVGKDTDMLIIAPGKGIIHLKPEHLEEFEAVMRESDQPLSDKIRKKIVETKVYKEVQEC